MAGTARSQRLRVRIDDISEEAAAVVSLRLVSEDAGELPEWEPGAHIDLHLPSGLIRQYSLCGDLDDRTAYRIAVLLEPNGRGGSEEVHRALRAGDTLTLSVPRNNFHLEDAPSYVFIAGGIGITPILPMVRAASRAERPWRLIYGGRSADSMAFLKELSELPAENICVVPQDEQGLLNLEQIVRAAPADSAVYCCGPTALIDAVLGMTTQLRPELPVRFERFSPLQIDVSDDEAIEVQLARSGRSVVVPAGTSILQAVREVGVEVESSCEEGTCGTCEAAVLGGTPEHRDSILTEAERKANDVMMICVGRSRTRLLVLDL